MKIAFRVDASARIGGGHVMRCLTLADELRARGATAVFVAAAIPRSLAERVRADGHDLCVIVPPDELNRGGEDWDRNELSVEAQALDANRTLDALVGEVEWLIVDHYQLGAPWHRAAGGAAGQLMVIDDLANRLLDCDLLLDETLGRAVSDYAPFVGDSATLLAGASYALLRPEFARERRAALERRRAMPPIRRVLVSLGMTDIGGVTASVVESLLRQKREWVIDVVLGERTESLAAVQALAAAGAPIQIHVNSSCMAELMSSADFAIGAGGTSAWERCCLGLPSATLVVAGNQALIASALARAGAAIVLPGASAAGEAVPQFTDDPERLLRMSAAASAVTDGRGTDRVADRMLPSEAMGQATVTR